MKTFASALAGILSVCVLSSGPVLANPYDPFGTEAGDDYYADPAYGQTGASPYGYQGTVGQGVQAAPQAQVAPIPRESVDFRGDYKPGTIVVSTAERRLYFVMPSGEAIRYGVGVGRPGFTWSGTKTVTATPSWPSRSWCPTR